MIELVERHTILAVVAGSRAYGLSGTDLGQALRSARSAFLSRRVAQTYGAYARQQPTRVANRRERTGRTDHKQAMHMIRLLHAGIHVLHTGEVLVDVSAATSAGS